MQNQAEPVSPTEALHQEMVDHQERFSKEHPSMPALHSGHVTMTPLEAGADTLFRNRHTKGTTEDGNRYFLNNGYVEAAHPNLLKGDHNGVQVPGGPGVIQHSHPTQERQRNPSAPDFLGSYYDRKDHGASNLIHLDRYGKTISFDGTLGAHGRPQFSIAHNPYPMGPISQTPDGRDRIPLPQPLSRPPSTHSSSGESDAESITSVNTDDMYG